MCGIVGLSGTDDAAVVDRMRDSLAHRGPDASVSVVFPAERLAFGHRRLRVIDLSPAADQPMGADGGMLWVVFNGEIFNFRELRAELESKGDHFRSQSDTEVILHAYRRWGTAAFARLNGMFAFALFDRRAGRVLLVRDQLGIKPLYYAVRGGRLAFASEIKALVASGLIEPAVNWQAVRDYFSFLYVPGPDTAFRDVFQLPPAHWLQFDVRTHACGVEEYWRLPRPRPRGAGDEPDNDVERVRELLAASVERQLVSDVPLGLFLSGGIDSAILAALMADRSARPVRTYTVTFTSPTHAAHDERAAARRIAERFGTDHHELAVSLDDPEALLAALRSFDQPFTNPTAYLMYLISREARTDLTVALCGAGGDELYGGYPRHCLLGPAKWLRRVPPLRAGARALVDAVGGARVRQRRLRKFIDGCAENDLAAQLLRWTYFFGEREKAELFGDAGGYLRADRVLRRHLESVPDEQDGNSVLRAELKTFLADNVLEYTDKMSMATSVEVRVPYLDVPLVEHAVTVPFGRKVMRGVGKAILKRAFAHVLPADHVRLRKHGFVAPIGDWLKGPLDRYFDRYMSPKVDGESLFDWTYVQRLRFLHRTSRRDLAHELLSIIVFDMWHRTYIRGRAADVNLS